MSSANDELKNPGMLLSRLGSLVRKAFAEELASHGLRPAHYGVLAVLAAGARPSQRELSASQQVDRGDMVRLIDDLEARKLATRVADPEDRRRYTIRITRAGESLVAELRAIATEVNDRFFAPLTRSERTQLTSLLVKIWRHAQP